MISIVMLQSMAKGPLHFKGDSGRKAPCKVNPMLVCYVTANGFMIVSLFFRLFCAFCRVSILCLVALTDDHAFA